MPASNPVRSTCLCLRVMRSHLLYSIFGLAWLIVDGGLSVLIFGLAWLTVDGGLSVLSAALIVLVGKFGLDC